VAGLTDDRFDLDDLATKVHSLNDAAGPMTDGGRDANPDGGRKATASDSSNGVKR
jgi:hypothetical protein